jgi:hypothetical protein
MCSVNDGVGVAGRVVQILRAGTLVLSSTAGDRCVAGETLSDAIRDHLIPSSCPSLSSQPVTHLNPGRQTKAARTPPA